MSDDKIKDEIKNLREIILKADKAYYVDSTPIMTDIEYDAHYEKLKKLEEKYPEYNDELSPTRRVGSDIDNDLPEKEHSVPILSLDKCYSINDLNDWIIKTNNKVDNEVEIIIEPKIDGAGVVLYYENGKLDKALTRGNGYSGNDITENIKTIKSVPLLVDSKESFAVRAEVFMTRDDFKIFNKEHGDEKYSNPRNLASGAVRRQKSKETSLYPLKLLCYEGFYKNINQKSHLEILMELKKLGFPLNDYLGFFSDKKIDVNLPFKNGVKGKISEINDYIKQLTEIRNKIPYDIDGLVIKINDIPTREKLGFTQHHPRWAIAYKFDAPLAETFVESIDVQIGRQGRATPVANLKPVQLSGSVISRATLHNQDYIDSLNVNINDKVSISKRGDVIPAVEEVLEKGDNAGPFKINSKCPSCKKELIEEGAHLFCKNDECPDRLLGTLQYFVARSQMDIESLGDKTIEFLFNHGFIKYISDIYEFDYNKLLEFEGFKEKKIKNIVDSISNSKNKNFETVLSSLGLKDIGNKAGELLANKFKDIDTIINICKNKNTEDFTCIDGIGEEISKSIIEHFSNPKILTLIDRLKKAGLNFKLEDKAVLSLDELYLKNTKWVITGSFENYKPRDLAGDIIKKFGGEILSAVSSKTTHLLCGESAGSKLDKAKYLGISIIYEKDFLDIIKNKKL